MARAQVPSSDASGSLVAWNVSTRARGDFCIDLDAAELGPRRRAFVAHPWVWLRQVHGASVVTVDRATAADACGTPADALVTADVNLVLAIHTADCAPVLFRSDEGVIGAAHAGWKGIEAGVVQHTVEAMRALGATTIDAWMGPCILPQCYEFGRDELDRLAARLGDEVRALTSTGTPALDVVAAVRAAAAEVGVAGVRAPGEPEGGAATEDDLAAISLSCTACNPDLWFSHRARQEAGRMATVIWREQAPS
jgi:YfiH family protein